jgi:cyclic beta-1,2-glucan synthetase
MHRAAIESIFGLDIGAHTLRFAPGLPSHWPRAEITLRRDGRALHFLLLRCSSEGALKAAAPWGAGEALQLLPPGQPLAWEGPARHLYCVVPLGAPGLC